VKSPHSEKSLSNQSNILIYLPDRPNVSTEFAYALVQRFTPQMPPARAAQGGDPGAPAPSARRPHSPNLDRPVNPPIARPVNPPIAAPLERSFASQIARLSLESLNPPAEQARDSVASTRLASETIFDALRGSREVQQHVLRIVLQGLEVVVDRIDRSPDTREATMTNLRHLIAASQEVITRWGRRSARRQEAVEAHDETRTLAELGGFFERWNEILAQSRAR